MSIRDSAGAARAVLTAQLGGGAKGRLRVGAALLGRRRREEDEESDAHFGLAEKFHGRSSQRRLDSP